MAQTTQAPVIQWQRILGPASDGAYTPQVARASNNGYAVSYSTILRLSESGSTLWQTTIPDSPDLPPGYPNTPTFITSALDGGFGVLVYNKFKWSLVRLDADGNVVWMKPFVDYLDGSSSLATRTLTNLIATADGGYMAIGYSNYPRSPSPTEIYKFDSDGNNTLKTSINIQSTNDPRPYAHASQVVQTNDGNYLLVGFASDMNGRSTSWATKVDQQLQKIWEKFPGGTELTDVIRSPDNNDLAIAIGTLTGAETRSIILNANGDVTGDFSLTNRVAGTKSLAAAGINSTGYTIVDVVNERQGDLRLQNTMGQNQGWLLKIGGSARESTKGIVAGSNGGYLVVGLTASTDGDVQGKTTADLSAWIVKLGPVVSTNEISSVRSGNWNDPSVWSCNCVPAGNNNMVIMPTHAIVLDATMPKASCQNLKIIGTFSIQEGAILVNGVH